MTLVKDNTTLETIKPAATLFLSTITYNNYHFVDKLLAVDAICSNLGRGKSMTERKAFLTFCEQAIINKVVSRSFFIKHFFETFLTL